MSESVLPDPPTIPRLLRQTAARWHAHPAIEEDGETWTWGQVETQAMTAARALLAHGIAHGDRVAIWAPNWREWIAAALGIHCVGAVLVPINTRLRGAEAADLLARSGARVLFTAGEFLGADYPAMLARHRPAGLERLIVLRGAREGEEGWADFLACGAEIDPAQAAALAAAIGADDLSDLMYTSGTTGRAKGVMSAHGQNLAMISHWARAMEMSGADRYLIVAPFFHSFGYKAGWLAALMHGATILPHAVFDAKRILERIARDHVSVLPGPPTLFHSLLAEPALASTDLSSLRATVTGAASIPPILIERMRNDLGFGIVLSAYGLTESCGFVTMSARGDAPETVARTSGRAMPGVELRLVDVAGNEVARGERGEVLVRGVNVMHGYFEDAAATAQAIDADGWLHTGDVGILDADACLAIVDRLKDMYISGGFNCYPAEIEKQVAAHPLIAQAAVVGIEDARLGEVGCAFVVLRPGAALDAPALIAWCRTQMANYKVPREVVFVDALPVNAGGKVLKTELRSMRRA
ncbi:MAG: FadD3 family acyl-CoA ligase [Rudaea sp.]|uniref:FadD3 family acyl-CoA ligase n=1 Tax=Rudaea sp. TaxID=2136325 RepID=UPI0039E47BA4